MLANKRKSHNQSFHKRGNTRYGSKKYSNPFFQSKKRKPINIDPAISWKIKLVLTALIVFAAALTWLFLYSSYFTINDIAATGEGNNLNSEKIVNITESQINNNMFILWPQKNIFLFNTETLKQNLENKYSFDKLVIDKKLPNKLTIEYIEKKHSVIWQEDEKFFYADKTGIIINETNPIEIKEKNYPLINNISYNKIKDNNIQIEEKYLDYCIGLFSELKNHESEFILEKLIIDDEINTVKAAIVGGPQIFFNINEPIERQINKLLVIKNQKIKDSFNSKSYIDVRIGDSVYYR